jgi:hypothetical protein
MAYRLTRRLQHLGYAVDIRPAAMSQAIAVFW